MSVSHFVVVEIGPEACADPAVAILVRYKYFTGIQTTLLVRVSKIGFSAMISSCSLVALCRVVH
jgi:hypothetical protein